MNSTYLWAASATLLLTNILTLIWALRTRVRPSKKIQAIQRLIAAFEVEGQTILDIRKVDPDNVFLRNPQR